MKIDDPHVDKEGDIVFGRTAWTLKGNWQTYIGTMIIAAVAVAFVIHIFLRI